MWWVDLNKDAIKRREDAMGDTDDDEFFKDWPQEEQQRKEQAKETEREMQLQDQEFHVDGEVDLDSSRFLRQLLCEQREEEESDEEDNQLSNSGGGATSRREEDLEPDWSF